MTYRKKLIEVALPLKAINEASAREKSIRHGHPSTLHLWWARRPLAACRAVLFASLVDDPDSDPMYAGAGEEITGAKRADLFNLIEELVQWENSNNPRVINRARAEIARSIAANKVADGEFTNDTVLHCGAGVSPADNSGAGVSAGQTCGAGVSPALSSDTLAGGTPAPQTGEAGETPTPQTVVVRDLKNLLAAPEAVNAFLAEHAPPVLDPFCGGGSIPLEAQRLGLRAYASDLNPVPVLITKALIEIPPKFAGMPPVNPEWQHQPEAQARTAHQPEASARNDLEASARPTTSASRDADGVARDASSLTRRVSVKQRPLNAAKVWQGAQGLAEDVRYYGRWMRDEAFKRIGHLYPKVKITAEMAEDRPDLRQYVGQELTVIAWLWARTVTSPDPACAGAHVPLVKSFWLSKKRTNRHWIDAVIDRATNSYRFEIGVGGGEPDQGTIGRKGGRCLLSGAPIPLDYIRSEGRAGRIGARLLAVVAEGIKGRVYVAPNHEPLATAIESKHAPELEAAIAYNPFALRPPLYGLSTFKDLFLKRQVNSLVAIGDALQDCRERIAADVASVKHDNFNKNGEPERYADAIATYLAFALSRSVDRSSTICTWDSSPKMEALRNTFARQAMPMTWDFAEGNPWSDSSGNWMNNVEWVAKCVGASPDSIPGTVQQLDATAALIKLHSPVVCCDPPYYNNIDYADLSDFFYVWLRRSLGKIYPTLFATVLTPKSQELVATPFRHHDDSEEAKHFFESGLNEVFERLRQAQSADFPLTVFYAFKQAEEDAETDGEQVNAPAVSSTGWETILEALHQAGCLIHGTWPIRTEMGSRMMNSGMNALASSIVLVCRPRPANAPLATRKDFMNALRAELPEALKNLQHGNIAPVDLAQAAIGPGMAVFTRYAKVVEADGSAMSVRTALGIINQVLDEVLAEQEGDFDPDTRWALAWFAEYGMHDGPFGVAETLSKAKNTAVTGLEEAGVVKARGGKVRLVGREELSDGWDPGADGRLTVWETTQHLIRALETQGESGAAALLARLGGIGETARELAYRLYTLCERKKWADEALAYNGLVIAWPELTKLAHARRNANDAIQKEIF